MGTETGRDKLPGALLADVKNHLNITWSDDATDGKIRGIVAGGIVYLNDKGGADFDYTADGEPRTLLFEYSRYARDEALEVFEQNYRHRINIMQAKERVAGYGTGAAVQG